MASNNLPAFVGNMHSAPYVPFFEPGFREIDGLDLNYLFSALFYLTGGGGATPAVQTILTTPGPVTITSQTLLVLKKSAASSTTVNLPATSARGSAPLLVYDWNGNAGDVTFVPAAGDLIGNKATWVLGSGGGAGSGGVIVLTPVSALPGWIPN